MLGVPADREPSETPEVAAGPGPASPAPPCSQGGCQPLPLLRGCEEVSRGVDYCTVSLPSGIAESLMRSPPVGRIEHVADGKGMRGYRQSAEYLVLGGSIWRRWEPISGSPTWGTAYETWEASGAAGAILAEWMVPYAAEVRTTRLDLAMDVACDDHLTPGQVIAPIADPEWNTDRGTRVRHKADGPEREWVWYVGARSSERMLRVYRKDLDQPMLYGGDVGPVMRVELELKKPLAHPMLEAWGRDEPSGWGAFGRHVYDLTGRQLVPISDLPAVERRSNVEALQSVLAFFEQHGGALDDMIGSGIDVCELAAVRSARPVKDSGQRARQKKRRIGIFGLVEQFGGVEQLQQYLREQLLQRSNEPTG